MSDPQAFIKIAREHNVPVLVDPKGKDFSRYKGATCLTPNKKEFELAVGPCKDEHELATKAQQLIQDCELDALLITLGARGMTLVTKDNHSIHIPARAREVYDVTGAGDT
ncbi:unnamed protein product, partial [marine sediment metagenome]